MNREDVLTLLALGYKIGQIAELYGTEETVVKGYLPEGVELAKLRMSLPYRIEKVMSKAFKAIDELDEPSPRLLLKAADLLRNLANDNLANCETILNMKLKEKELNTEVVPEQLCLDGCEPDTLERIMEMYKKIKPNK